VFQNGVANSAGDAYSLLRLLSGDRFPVPGIAGLDRVAVEGLDFPDLNPCQARRPCEAEQDN